MNETQRARQHRNDAISAMLADVDKGQHGRRHHRFITTTEGAWIDDEWVEALRIQWCWDCGRERVEADRVETPNSVYDDHPGVGFCGYTAKTPGPWWTKTNLDVVAV